MKGLFFILLLLGLVEIVSCHFTLEIKKFDQDLVKIDLVQKFKSDNDPVLYAKLVSVQVDGKRTAEIGQGHFPRNKDSVIRIHAKIYDGSSNFVKDEYFEAKLIETKMSQSLGKETMSKTPSVSKTPPVVMEYSLAGFFVAGVCLFGLLIIMKQRKQTVNTDEEYMSHKSRLQSFLVDDLELYV